MDIKNDFYNGGSIDRVSFSDQERIADKIISFVNDFLAPPSKDDIIGFLRDKVDGMEGKIYEEVLKSIMGSGTMATQNYIESRTKIERNEALRIAAEEALRLQEARRATRLRQGSAKTEQAPM